MTVLSSPGAPLWSPRQRRWLQALGHVVYRAGGDMEEPVAEAAGESREAATVSVPHRAAMSERKPASQDCRPVPSRPMPATAAVVEPEPEPGSRPAQQPSMRRPARLPDRLQLAMLRASGLDPADPDAQAAMAQWPVDRLRGDGAAKRAFWPQLRALRRRP